MNIEKLGWIDTFYAGARKHLFVRKEDNVLIIPPNKVYKLNSTGAALLRFLAEGHKIADFPGLGKNGRATDVNTFFRDLEQLFSGADPDPEKLPAVERITYDFSYTRLPVLGEIALTYRCNNRCVFCYVDGTSCGTAGYSRPDRVPQAASSRDFAAGREMSTREIKKIVRIFKEEARIPFFSFTGGEPLLRKDLEGCISYAVKKGLTVNLITNGTLCTPERARSLADAGLRTAQVSIESPEAEIHDRLTGRPGSFAESVAGIKAMQEAGISVQTNTTLTAVNAESVPELPRFLKYTGISSFSANLFIPTGNGKGNPDLFLSYSEAGPYIDFLKKEAAARGLTFYWYSPMPYCIYNPIAKGLGNKSCAAVDGLISVNPAGELLPCSSYSEPVGNLLAGSFTSVWFSERGSYFKNKLYAPEECRGCGAFTACQGACPLYWHYAGTEELRAGGRRCGDTGEKEGRQPGTGELRRAAWDAGPERYSGTGGLHGPDRGEGGLTQRRHICRK